MGGQLVRRRAEVAGPYRRPLRYVAATAWRTESQLRWRARAFAAFAITTAAGAVAGSLAVRAIGVFGLFIGGFSLIPWVTEIASRTLRLRRAWRRRTELRDVLRRRPHAGSEDPDLVHDLFAVTAEDDGVLLTWRFTMLAIDEEAGPDSVEVPGRPRYAASVVEDRAFAIADAARAAEQLVEAQDRAAQREAQAAAAARRALAAGDADAELAIEARTTAAALQRATGQRSARD